MRPLIEAGRDGARPRQVREGRRIGAARGDRDRCRSQRSASGRRARWRFTCRCRRTAAPTFEALGRAALAPSRRSRVSLELDVQGPAAEPLRVRADVSPQRVSAVASDWSRRSSRSAARDRCVLQMTRHAMPEVPMPELLEFEEPIGVLLKEIEALSMLPPTPERERSIESAAAPRRLDPRRDLRQPDAVAARARRAPSEPARTRSTTSSGCSPTSTSCTAIAASPTTTRSSPASRDYKDEPVAVIGHQKGARHQAEDLPQLRLRAARGLPQGAARRCSWPRSSAGRSSSSSTRRRPIRASSRRSAASPRPSRSTCAR